MVAILGMFRTGFCAIARHPVQSLLSVTTVAVGIAAVIVTVALGQGARTVIVEQILASGTNAVFVNPGSPTMHGVRHRHERSAVLTVADGVALREAIPWLKWICWTVGDTVEVSRSNRNWQTRVVGITPHCLSIRNWSFAEGDPFADEDFTDGRTVAILGQTVAERLFGSPSAAMGARIRIAKIAEPSEVSDQLVRNLGGDCPHTTMSEQRRFEMHLDHRGPANAFACGAGASWACLYGTSFSPFSHLGSPLTAQDGNMGTLFRCVTPAWEFDVVGVLAPKGVNAYGFDLDDVVYVPFSTSLRKVRGHALVESVEAILASTANREDLGAAVEEIRSVLRSRRAIGPDQGDDFTIKTDVEMSGVSHAADADLVAMLTAIAAVSLLAAGIGIMNISLVSVKERMREIGVRMAVGAKRRHILMQFLIEAMTLSLVGGCVGILFGILGARLTTVIAGWPTIISGQTVAAAFLFSMAVGLVFGAYPASKAARVNPIDVLRFE